MFVLKLREKTVISNKRISNVKLDNYKSLVLNQIQSRLENGYLKFNLEKINTNFSRFTGKSSLLT